MAEINAESNSYDEQTVSLGERLRRTREEKKLTVEKVAADLRLTRETIVNLEAENWHKLYAKTYARGYFINYVKYLGLPQNVLTATFNFHYQVDHDVNEKPQLTEPVKKSSVVPIFIAISAIVITYGVLSLFMTGGNETIHLGGGTQQLDTMSQEQKS